MAVTVTDRRSVLAYGDSYAAETADAGAGSWNTGATHTLTYAEASSCIANAYNEASGSIYWELNTGSLNWSDTMVYVQTQVIATQLAWNAVGDGGTHALFLTDGANDVTIWYSGNDRRQFSHDTDGQVGWQCFLFDLSLFGNKTAGTDATSVAGTFASFDSSSVTGAGAYFTTQSKALGGGVNCYVDIIRYGNNGIRVEDGTTGDEGNFFEITVEDKSNLDGKAHGIIRAYTTGIYGVQGPITIGNSSAGTTDTYFEDNGVIVGFEARDVADDKYYFNVEGHASTTTYCVIRNSTISTAGPYVSCNFASGNIDTLTFDTVTFSALGNTLTFSNNTDATGHTVNNCTFTECGQIDPGDVTFSGNSISATTAPTTGALLLDGDGADNWSDITITAGDGTTEHGIYIDSTGTYSFAGIVGIGYDATNGGDFAFIYNNSGGAVTINADSDCAGLSYLNGSGASTTINNSVTLTVTVKDAVTLANIEGARVYMTTDSGSTLLFNDLTNASGVVTTSYNYTATKTVAGWVRKGSSSPLYRESSIASSITSAGLSITILLIGDE
jgi:hypothetical protein